ncbi:MAG TPA: S1 family peptidase [Tahibacter sp.]|uniref:S1 family peptidase n=1 Tax=Tahibacter sp. TaxID=2056211 RepID=UPI002C2F0ED0|nr:S1 family peptidase [Tahibacter sp.]HSX62104.1 S1 family peptidase [Tahibacter sp.]
MRNSLSIYRCRRSGLAGSVVLAASQIFVAASVAAAENGGLSPALQDALQRDMGLSPEQIAQYRDVERRMPSIERDARAAFGAAFGGIWMERDTRGQYQAVIAVAGVGADAAARSLGAQVRRVDFSLAQLETARSHLDDPVRGFSGPAKADGADPRIHSWYVDPKRNSVIVNVDPGATAVAVDFIAASKADAKLVRVVEEGSRPVPTFDIRGGDPYIIGGTSACSIGFSVTLGIHNGYVTAGHCGAVNATVTTASGASMGYFYDSVFPGSDLAVVHNTNSQGVPQPWVNAYSFGGNLIVRGSTPAAIGATVCRSGFRTGARCGVLNATQVTVNYAAGPVTGLSMTSACVGFGDSGGSFVTPDGQAQGVNSGGSIPNGVDNCAEPSPVSFFQPLLPILLRYPGLTLVTGS